MANAQVDQDTCIGCGTCVGLCPAVFMVNMETGKAEVLEDADYSSCDVEEAVDSCPVQAISLSEGEEE